MLDLNRCMIMESYLREVASTVGNVEEGVPMIHVLENGVGVLAKAAGNSGEMFAGVSQSKHIRPTTGRMVETLKVPASGTYAVSLSRTPTGAAADRGVFNAGGTALTSAAAVDAATKYNLTGKTVTVDSSLAGQDITIQYQYDFTATESALMFGSDLAVLDVIAAKNIGVIDTGVIYTTCYDPGVNWATTTAVKLGAGIFTGSGGSGTAVTAIVVSVPTAGDAFLGLHLKS